MSSNSSSNGTAAVESKPTVNGTAKTKPAAQTKKSAAAKSKAATKSKKVDARARIAGKAGVKSRVESPVATAWAIFDKHVDARRSEAIQAAVDAGINPWTARTQYQRWLHAEAE